MRNYQDLAPLVLRVGIGAMFLYAGVMKLFDPAMVSGMLGGIGFPAPTFWAWVLIVCEALGGLAVLLGFQLKYVTVPLAVILLVATLTVHLGNPGVALQHVALLAGTISLWLSGPGTLAVSKQ